jgi:hypothetical protein
MIRRAVGSGGLAALLLLGSAHAAPLAGGRISLFAGQVGRGFAGDGEPAAIAELANPYGLAADAHGNVFIADYDNLRIRKVDAHGRTAPGCRATFPASSEPMAG